jgi:outer membrane lipoprotein-sorting protein
MRLNNVIIPLLLLICSVPTRAQDTDKLLERVKTKLASVTDYQAEGVMKTDVSFMKVPESKVTVYYKKPDRFRIKKEGGISIVPKGGVNINLGALFVQAHRPIGGAHRPALRANV